MSRVLVLPEVIFHTDDPYVGLLEKAGFQLVFPPEPEPTDSDEVVNLLEGCQAVIAGAEVYNDGVLDRLPDLRVVARFGVGYDRIDVDAATRYGVAVTITPNSNHGAVAELAMGLLFALAKFTPRHQREIREGVWSRVPLIPLRGSTLGIVGLGRIGRSMAERAVALGMQVLAAEKFPDQAFLARHGIELVELDALLSRSDFVTLHAPLNDETRHLINRDTLARMKPGSYLINTARGGLVDEHALLAALKSGHVAGAGLDVFEQEPPPTDHPLLRMENVVAAPHMAGCDELSRQEMAYEAANCIVRLSRGEWPEECVVNPEVRDNWRW